MSKPDWKDAPKFARHLWYQSAYGSIIYCWSDHQHEGATGLWAGDIEGRDEFRFWPESWVYVEERP